MVLERFFCGGVHRLKIASLSQERATREDLEISRRREFRGSITNMETWQDQVGCSHGLALRLLKRELVTESGMALVLALHKTRASVVECVVPHSIRDQATSTTSLTGRKTS